MANNISVDKNNEKVYNFYHSSLIKPNKLKNKNVLLFELGNYDYIEEVKKNAKTVYVIDSCNLNEDFFETINKLEKQIKSFLEKNKMPKFDIAIMNPPYDDGSPAMSHIDEKIVLCIKNSVKLGICVDMAGWFLDKTNKIRNKEKEHCVDFITSAKILKKEEFNEIFGIGASQDGFIFTFTNNKTDWFDKCWDVKNPIYKILKNAPGFFTENFKCNHGTVVQKNNTIYLKRKTFNKTDKFLFEYKDITGAVHQYDYECQFNTVTEKENFLKSFDTTFMKFILKQIRTGRIIRLSGMPFMLDYKKPWTDERFKNTFNLTKAEWNFIEKSI